MNEAKFSLKLKKILNDMDNVHFFKEHGSVYSAGVADLIGCYEGKFIALELKVVTLPKRDSTDVKLLKELTALQLEYLRNIKDSYGFSAVAILVEPLKEILYIHNLYTTTNLENLQKLYTFKKYELINLINQQTFFPSCDFYKLDLPKTISKRGKNAKR